MYFLTLVGNCASPTNVSIKPINLNNVHRIVADLFRLFDEGWHGVCRRFTIVGLRIGMGVGFAKPRYTLNREIGWTILDLWQNRGPARDNDYLIERQLTCPVDDN